MDSFEFNDARGLAAKRLTYTAPYPLMDGMPLDAELCSFPRLTLVSTLLW